MSYISIPLATIYTENISSLGTLHLKIKILKIAHSALNLNNDKY